MSKPVVNNKIIYQNIYGLVAKHESFLDQGVRAGDSPTFANLHLTGDATVTGNLYVEGNTTILNTNVIEFEDNIVLLNRLETGSGVTLNQSGFEIERGTLENYRVVFNEIDDTFRIGVISNMQAVATREDVPLTDGIMMWNSTTKRLDSRNQITIDITSLSTTNSTSVSSGSIVMMGGLGIAKDIRMGGRLYLGGPSHTSNSVIWTNTTTASLNITSVGDINITPGDRINIPYDRKIILGDPTQSIVAETGTRNIVLTGAGNVDFVMDAGKRIRIPNQIPITFSTQFEQIYADSSNNMIIGAGQNINLTPGANKKVVIPVDIGLIFSNNNQQISANLNNDLSLVAGNNILLTPGPTLDVRIPTDNGIKFGSSGAQRIYADSSNDLYIGSASEIYLNATDSVNIPAGVELTFGGVSRYIRSTGDDLTVYTDRKKLYIDTTDISCNSTLDAVGGTTASIWTAGGIGVKKRVYVESGITIDSDSTTSFVARKANAGQNIFVVDTTGLGRVNVLAGNGTQENPSMTFSCVSLTQATGLISLRAPFDNNGGYLIGRGTDTLNAGRTLTANIPVYADYGSSGDIPKFSVTSNFGADELFSVETETGNVFVKGTFGLGNTQDAMSPTSAAFVISGGLGVVKRIVTSGDIWTRTASATALDVKDPLDNSILRVDTGDDNVFVNGKLAINNTSGVSLDIGGGAFVVDTVTGRNTSALQTYYTNTTDSSDVSHGAVVVSGGIGIAKSLRVGGTSYLNGVDMTSTRITNMQNPTNPQDAATKAYVDLVKQGLYVKDSVQAATIMDGNLNVSYNTGVVLDGYTLQTGDRILIKDQLTPSENGIYIVQETGVPLRAVDFAVGSKASGTFVFVINGGYNGALGWICNSVSGYDTVGTDDLYFTQFTAMGQIDAGDALSKTFNRIDVNVDGVSLEIESDSIRIKSTALGVGLTGGSGLPIETLSDQSHVTKLGTIDTGVWQGTAIDVFYGGTGRTQFPQGNLIFGGGGLDPLNTDPKLYYDSVSGRLGVGTDQPTRNLHVSSITDVSMLLSADSDGASAMAKPEIVFAYSGDTKSFIGMSRGPNEYASNVYSESLVISHDKLDATSVIQLATSRQNRVTVLANGNVGINTSNPSSRLHVTGTLTATDITAFRSTMETTNVSNGAVIISGGVGIRRGVQMGGRLRIYDTTPSTSINTGAVIVQGGLSVQGNQNAVNVGNGGALTVQGGGSFGGDLYVGGSINGSGSSSSTYAYLTLTATDEAINLSSGSLVTFGGITIQAMANAYSVTEGGSFLTDGGASIRQDLYIGGNCNIYGKSIYYGGNDLLEFWDEFNTLRYTIKRDSSTNDFSLGRYDITGAFVEHSLIINSETGRIGLENGLASDSGTSASFVLTGGLSVGGSDDVSSVTSGGGVTVVGGMAIGKGVMVGGDVVLFSTTDTVDSSTGALVVHGGVSVAKDLGVLGNVMVGGTVTTDSRFSYNGGGQMDVITNTGLTPVWYYFGKINDLHSVSSCEIHLSNNLVNPYGVRVIVNVNAAVCNVSHNYYGEMSETKTDVYVYRDLADGFHVFTRTAGGTTTNVTVCGKSGERFDMVAEGTGNSPDGSSSLYSGAWSVEYTTTRSSTLAYSFGDVKVDGLHLDVADNFPVFGYNNENVTGSRDLGIAFQRYQSSNDTGSGELVTDPYVFFDSIPNQSTASSDQIKFSNVLNATDNYYNGWWIRVGTGANTDQVRQIVSYNGAQRVATLDSAWTSGNPANGDTVYFYNAQYVSFYYDDTIKSFRLVYNTRDPLTKAVTSYDYASLQLKTIQASDTTASTSVSSGSITTLGGIGICNTTDANSATAGGTLTTLGGVGVRKRLYVGENIGVGSDGFTPAGSVHVKQTVASAVLETAADSVSYVDFTETGTSRRFGIVSDTLNNQFSMTFTGSGATPDLANKFLTANDSGYIGILTTSGIASPLTLRSGSFVSAHTNTGYIGLVGGSTNTNNSTNAARVVVYGNNAIGSAGNLDISTGTSGTFRISTNDTERLRIDQFGNVTILTTTLTKSTTTGALVVTGGVGVTSTENATGFSSGGALSVAGGGVVGKDLFVGGDLFITGNINAAGSSTAPVITFVNPVNCTLTGYDNNQLLSVSQEAIFSFVVWVTPTVASQNCQIEFSAPGRTNGFMNRSEYIATCSGYTDDDEVIPLFNVISVAVKGENRGLIKFQSVSTGIHYFSVICRYTMA